MHKMHTGSQLTEWVTVPLTNFKVAQKSSCHYFSPAAQNRECSYSTERPCTHVDTHTSSKIFKSRGGGEKPRLWLPSSVLT